MVALALVACSDGAKPRDTGPGLERRRDLGREAAPGDIAVDAAPDLRAADGAREARAPDGKPSDGALKDKGKPDVAGGDGGMPYLSGWVSRTATPVGDGKGELYVGVYLAPFPLQLVGTQITSDLSQPGAKVKYEIWGPPPVGNYTLFAFLDDNNNAAMPFVMPDAGDLVMSKPLALAVPASPKPQLIDLVLDKVEGGIVVGDGGVPDGNILGSLKGKVTAGAAAAGDGKGSLFVSIHSQPPPAGAVASTAINGADLSSPYTSESYFLSGIPAGNYYLYVWLDDNGNFNHFAPGPDKGDLVQSKPIQLHIVGGIMNTQDAVLDLVKP